MCVGWDVVGWEANVAGEKSYWCGKDKFGEKANNEEQESEEISLVRSDVGGYKTGA
jgi:hypothetical protein